MLLSDDKLRLRALEPTDLDVLFQWENNTELWRVGSTIAPFSRKQLWDYIKNYDADIFTTRQLRLMIEEITSGMQVGMIDLFDFDPINNHAYLGLLIDKNWSGLGYGFRSVKIIEDYCIRYFGLHQLVLIIAVDNIPCINLFEKLGYKNTGILKSWIKSDEGYTDAKLYQKILSI